MLTLPGSDAWPDLVTRCTDSPFLGAPLGAAAMAESIKEESSMGFEKWRASVVSMAENPPVILSTRIVYSQEHAAELAERLARTYPATVKALPFVAPV